MTCDVAGTLESVQRRACAEKSNIATLRPAPVSTIASGVSGAEKVGAALRELERLKPGNVHM